jgi:hypothetical protein
LTIADRFFVVARRTVACGHPISRRSPTLPIGGREVAHRDGPRMPGRQEILGCQRRRLDHLIMTGVASTGTARCRCYEVCLTPTSSSADR